MALTDQTFLQLITRLAHELNDCVALTATSNGTLPIALAGIAGALEGWVK